jgi:hypothetical protein
MLTFKILPVNLKAPQYALFKCNSAFGGEKILTLN